MSKKTDEEIAMIISGLNCYKDYKCCFSDQTLCKARNIGLDNYLECLEDSPTTCEYSISYGSMYLCQCELRNYLAKHKTAGIEFLSKGGQA